MMALVESDGMYPTLSQSRPSTVWSICFVLLIVSPVTAPFQTVSFAELLVRTIGHQSAQFASASGPVLVSSSTDTAVAILRSRDGSVGRVKLESRSATDTWHLATTRAVTLTESLAPAVLIGESEIMVLRL
jgi:hypothetical protein